MRSDLYKRHRFPSEIISHCVWLYHRFGMSFREVEELMFERGVLLSYKTVRRWYLKFRHLFKAHNYRQIVRERFSTWCEVTELAATA